MTQRDALLTAVCANPDDDLPRLVFADWCDENGEPERAEFIHVQVEIAKGAEREKLAVLQEREEALLKEHRPKWTEYLEKFTDNYLYSPFVFRRGFVEGISINDELLIERGDELFRLAPIRTLYMGDQDGFGDLHECNHLLRVTKLEITGSRLDNRYGNSGQFFGSKFLANLGVLIALGHDDNGHLDATGLRAVVESKHLTKLRRLEIGENWLFNIPAAEHPEMTRLLMAVGNLPSLTDLGLGGIGLLAPVIRELAAQPWMSRIKDLDLSRNHAGDAGGQALAESPHLENIERLDLRHNDGFDGETGSTPMSVEVKQLLRRRFGERMLLDD